MVFGNALLYKIAQFRQLRTPLHECIETPYDASNVCMYKIFA